MKRISKKKINNPFIKDRRKRKFKRKCQIIAIIILLILLSLLYIFFWSNFFRVKNVKITNSIDNKEEIIEILEENLVDSKNNIFYVSDIQITDLLKDYNFKEINIKKKLPRTIEVEIKERSDSYIYKEENNVYSLDNDSYISKKFNICEKKEETEPEFDQEIAGDDDYNPEDIKSDETSENCVNSIDDITKDKFMPLIENMGSPRLDSSGEYVKIDEDYLFFAKELYSNLGFDSDFRVKKFILDESINTIKVVLHNDMSLFLNLEDDHMEQIRRFEDIKKGLKEEIKTIDYIDMRYGDKIYYN
jgi:cell division septal protein FtsQ